MVARRPSNNTPSKPPTPCTPQTSSASSHPIRFFRPTARKQTIEATRPTRHAEAGETKPAAGVIVARPATVPVSNPTNFGLEELIQSRQSQVHPATAAARSVFKKATAVTESTRNSEPALKPNHPNHSSPVPSATIGTLWGPRSRTLRLPR